MASHFAQAARQESSEQQGEASGLQRPGETAHAVVRHLEDVLEYRNRLQNERLMSQAPHVFCPYNQEGAAGGAGGAGGAAGGTGGAGGAVQDVMQQMNEDTYEDSMECMCEDSSEKEGAGGQ